MNVDHSIFLITPPPDPPLPCIAIDQPLLETTHQLKAEISKLTLKRAFKVKVSRTLFVTDPHDGALPDLLHPQTEDPPHHPVLLHSHLFTDQNPGPPGGF